MTGEPTSIMEAALAKRLRCRPDMQQGKVTVNLLPGGGVELSRTGIRLGVWIWHSGEFAFHSEKQNNSMTAQTIMGAIALTSAIIDN